MRNIIKRDGTVRPYEPEKIITAMGKAFRETAAGTSREEMERLLRAVEKEMEHKDGGWAVEDIQDAVERVLMENGRYEEAKRYILYRHRRNEQRAARRAMAQAAGVPALDGVLAKIEKDFPNLLFQLPEQQSGAGRCDPLAAHVRRFLISWYICIPCSIFLSGSQTY